MYIITLSVRALYTVTRRSHSKYPDCFVMLEFAISASEYILPHPPSPSRITSKAIRAMIIAIAVVMVLIIVALFFIFISPCFLSSGAAESVVAALGFRAEPLKILDKFKLGRDYRHYYKLAYFIANVYGVRLGAVVV